MNREDVITYIEGGRGSFTLLSKGTGRHYTYRVRAGKGRLFLSGLVGPDHYEYLGMIVDGPQLVATRASKCPDGKQFRAMQWFLDFIRVQERLPDSAEFKHNGTCGRCGRELTTPESIDRGIGPVCITKGQ